MSFKYALFRLLLRAIGFKKAMGGDLEAILAKAREECPKSDPRPLRRRDRDRAKAGWDQMLAILKAC